MTDRKPVDYPLSVLDAWCFWEAFRRLGFSSDDIFWELAKSADYNGKLALHISLRTQSKTFNVVCSPPLSKEEADELEAEVRSWNESLPGFDEADLLPIWNGSRPKAIGIHLILKLQANGFQVPNQEEQ